MLKVSPYSISHNNYQKRNNNVSFGRTPLGVKKISNKAIDVASEGVAKVFSKLADWSPIQKFSQKVADKNIDIVAHLSAIVGLTLSGFYMRETAKSKKIEPEQKLPLIINQGAVAILSTIGAYALDKKLIKIYDKFSNAFLEANKNTIKNPDVFKRGLKNARTLMVFGLVYRFIGPVIATPIANSISSMVCASKHKKEKAS